MSAYRGMHHVGGGHITALRTLVPARPWLSREAHRGRTRQQGSVWMARRGDIQATRPIFPTPQFSAMLCGALVFIRHGGRGLIDRMAHLAEMIILHCPLIGAEERTSATFIAFFFYYVM